MITKTCPVCDKIFLTKQNKKYSKTTCSNICSNKFFIRRIKKTPNTFKCINCNNEDTFVASSKNKYCCIRCKIDFEYKTQTLPRFNKGAIFNRIILKKVLTKLYGYKCMVCGLKTWLDKTVSLELDHIDGNSSNNDSSNLRMLCPNCHSQTPTWKARNKGNGRGSRGLPLN